MNRYAIALSGALLLSGCGSLEPIETQAEENFTGRGDRFLYGIGDKLRNYDKDRRISFQNPEEFLPSYFPVRGLKEVKIGRATVEFSYHDSAEQSVPGYEGQLFVKCSPSLKFRYRKECDYLILDRIDGEFRTELDKTIPKPVAVLSILASTGMMIDPELEIDRIVIGEFEGVYPAMMIEDRKQKTYCFINLKEMKFISTDKEPKDIIKTRSI